jgi:hypothetical protein
MHIDNVKMRLYDYIRVLQKDCPDYMRVEIDEGRRYYKVNVCHSTLPVGDQMYPVPSQRVVHSFVDKKTGDLYMPASWRGPAKGIRYNLMYDWEVLQEKVDWAGSYLYK